MKALILLFLRVTTGLLLIIWGMIKLMAPKAAIGISDTYYGGLISAEALQTPIGAAQIALGALVIIGFMRKVFYPIQAVVLGYGVFAIWQYILDPFGLYLLNEETRQVLFFPSTTVFAATLVMLAFKDDDTISLDTLLGR